MKILRNDSNQNIVLNSETNFRTDLGWEESFQEFEKDTLKSIINSAVNFETVRYAHKLCTGGTGNIEQMDIWFYFYFYNNDNPPTHIGGLNYEYVGLTVERNSKVLRQDNDSFFRLEFYKVPEGQNPNSSNRKLVFTKHLPIPLGEKVKYTPNNEYIFVPIFMGSNFRNKENAYIFWFQDNTVLDGTLMSGNTFYVTAKFFNTIDGKTINFTNSDKAYIDVINEETDVYYRMDIERTGYTYTIYSGMTEVGCSTNPIRFYAGSESSGSIIPPTPSVTRSITPSPTPTQSLLPVLSPTPTRSVPVVYHYYVADIYRCPDGVFQYETILNNLSVTLSTGRYYKVDTDVMYIKYEVGHTGIIYTTLSGNGYGDYGSACSS